jgi:hypothetical protein
LGCRCRHHSRRLRNSSRHATPSPSNAPAATRSDGRNGLLTRVMEFGTICIRNLLGHDKLSALRAVSDSLSSNHARARNRVARADIARTESFQSDAHNARWARRIRCWLIWRD